MRIKRDSPIYLLLCLVACYLLMLLIFFIIPGIYFKHTGRSMFPPEPEQIIEPSVMSTKMIEAEKESYSKYAYEGDLDSGMSVYMCGYGSASETGKIIRENGINYEY